MSSALYNHYRSGIDPRKREPDNDPRYHRPASGGEKFQTTFKYAQLRLRFQEPSGKYRRAPHRGGRVKRIQHRQCLRIFETREFYRQQRQCNGKGLSQPDQTYPKRC